jgi:hypothetical protein
VEDARVHRVCQTSLRLEPLSHHASYYSKTVTGLSSGLTQAHTMEIFKAAFGRSTPTLYAAVVNSVNNLWRSNDDGVTVYTQLDNAKTKFSSILGMVLTVNHIIFNW